MDELLQQELDKAKIFFENQGKNDKCWYKLYSIKSVDSTYGRDDSRSRNFTSNSMTESLEMLERDMKMYGDTSKEFWCLKHYTTTTDPQPVSLILKNPFFNPANHKGYMQMQQNSVNGFGQGGGGMLEFMREHYTQMNAMNEKMMQLKHEVELREKDRIIEDLEASKRGKFDAINDFLETPVGSQLSQVLLQVMAANLFGQKQPVQQQQVQQEQEQPTTQHDSSNQDQQAIFEKVQNSMKNFERVFGSDAINALEQISVYCTENPDMAYQIFQNRQAQNGKGK